ncbi:glycosyltransferase family 9 protein [Phenylobacterium sp.]|jgi:tetratricopeptide (TPR) repeat protein|uniref:glycosyltransferase family 9 protein n=1 Tax=Phenylobacterium sp. TaxID=1871053 RepID=UPI002F94F4F3
MPGAEPSLQELIGAAREAAKRGVANLSEVEGIYEEAAHRFPHSGEAFHWLGVVKRQLGKPADAEAAFRRALALDASLPATRRLLSMAVLAQGRYPEGFELYEARHELPAMAKPALPQPEWRGEDVKGKRVLIWPEQGFGDQIMFARFAVLLKTRGADVTLLCRPGLVRLLQGSLGVRTLGAEGAVDFPDPDYWVMTCSLAWRCGATVETVPNAPYLRPVSAWPSLGEGFKVGLVTRGNPGHMNDPNRSLPPEWAERLRALPAQIIELDPAQTGAKDFADTAAIIDQLDLVISVDTAMAHLAGAMGKPCWVMLSGVETDWRWMTDRADSPWYPSMRLYRQTRLAEWSDVIQRIETDFKALLSDEK